MQIKLFIAVVKNSKRCSLLGLIIMALCLLGCGGSHKQGLACDPFDDAANCYSGSPAPTGPTAPVPTPVFTPYLGNWAGTWSENGDNGTLTLVISDVNVADNTELNSAGTVTESAYGSTASFASFGDSYTTTGSAGQVATINPPITCTLTTPGASNPHLIAVNWQGSLSIGANGHLTSTSPNSYYDSSPVLPGNLAVLIDLTKQ